MRRFGALELRSVRISRLCLLPDGVMLHCTVSQLWCCEETTMTTARDEPWIFRTYSGHSTAEKSNALYRSNLAKGQTGLSIAFDLPTQTGYDADHRLASPAKIVRAA